MEEPSKGFLIGTLHLVAGVFLLLYLDKVVEFDRKRRIKWKAFFRRKLGNSFLNHELWQDGISSSFRASRIAFRLMGVILLIIGIAWLLLTLRYWHPLSGNRQHFLGTDKSWDK